MNTDSPMLSPDQISAGPIALAGDGLTLVMPRTAYENTLLIARTPAGLFATILSGKDSFISFPAENNNSFSGLLVGGVRIEVDPRTACDVRHESPPPGTITRSGSDLFIAAIPSEGMRFGTALVPLATGLPPLPEKQKVGFLTWQVVLGSAQEKQVLAQFSVATPTDG